MTQSTEQVSSRKSGRHCRSSQSHVTSCLTNSDDSRRSINLINTDTLTMRKGAGISALSRHTATTTSYANLSTTISSQNLASLTTSLAQFHEALTTFAQAHKADIKRDPAFRHQFQKMCAAIGVDPLSGSTSSSRRGGVGGVWDQVLGLGEWVCEVAVQVVDVCVSTRPQNGGTIAMDELVNRITKMRGPSKAFTNPPANASTSDGDSNNAAIVTEDDILRAIDMLKPLNAGYSVIRLAGKLYVRSVPRELDTDLSTLLILAATTFGKLSTRMVRASTGWTDMRANTALENAVMREGMAWVDEQTGGEREVWFIAATSFED